MLPLNLSKTSANATELHFSQNHRRWNRREDSSIQSNIPFQHFGAGALAATSEGLLAPICARLGSFDLLKNLRMTRALVSVALLVRSGGAQAHFSSQHGSFWRLERLIFAPIAWSVPGLRNIGRSYDCSTSELARDTPKSTENRRDARLRSDARPRRPTWTQKRHLGS